MVTLLGAIAGLPIAGDKLVSSTHLMGQIPPSQATTFRRHKRGATRRKVVATARPPRVKEKGLGVRKKRSGGKKKGREV